jgi:DNA (cytosine-5)-methyltransferase 1
VNFDLFGGAGGWEEGARRLGVSLLGVENDPDACLTRAAAGLETLAADVAALDPLPCEGVVASPPCQAWSRAGKRLGKLDKPLVWEALGALADGEDVRAELRPRCQDERSLLVVEPLRWALASMPAWVALEQVPDVLEVWEGVAAVLARRGYHVWAGVLNAANYGVPQTRERAILIAAREHPVGPPAPTHSDQRRGGCLLGLEPWVSMAEALGWDGTLKATQRNSSTGEYGERDSGEPAFAVATNADRWRHRPARTICGNRAPRWTYPTLDTRRDQREGGKTHQQLEADRPALSLTGKSGGQWLWRNGNQDHAAERAPDGEAQFQRDAVPVSIEEAAILQDFPPDWPWQGNKTSRFRQCGNAIPPGLAAAVLAVATGRQAFSGVAAAKETA